MILIRVGAVTTIGLALAAASFGVSRVTDGIVGAALFMVAILLVPISLAIGAAGVVDRWPIRSGKPAAIRSWLATHVMGKPLMAELARCGGCGKPRVVLESVWVCARCDHAPAA